MYYYYICLCLQLLPLLQTINAAEQSRIFAHSEKLQKLFIIHFTLCLISILIYLNRALVKIINLGSRKCKSKLIMVRLLDRVIEASTYVQVLFQGAFTNYVCIQGWVGGQKNARLLHKKCKLGGVGTWSNAKRCKRNL